MESGWREEAREEEREVEKNDQQDNNTTIIHIRTESMTGRERKVVLVCSV